MKSLRNTRRVQTGTKELQEQMARIRGMFDQTGFEFVDSDFLPSNRCALIACNSAICESCNPCNPCNH